MTELTNMKTPFWKYYGAKWRAAPKYPQPKYLTIVEPFAGAAGYSMRYCHLNVILVEKYPIIAEMWRFLIGSSSDDIRRIPAVDHIDDLPSWVSEGGRSLVGFTLNYACVSPRRTLSAGRKQARQMGRRFEGWNIAQRERVALQVPLIKHWKIIEGSYEQAPDVEATWFVDPPYNNKAGRAYVHKDIDYLKLGDWCRSRRGQAIVCENEGADWLPFRPFRQFQGTMGREGSKEAIWTND